MMRMSTLTRSFEANPEWCELGNICLEEGDLGVK